MITVREVKTKKEQKAFLDFPLDLYAGNPCFVPPLYMDEKKIFRSDYVYNDCCDAAYFLAYKDGVVAGRIQGIIQKASNEKNGEKRARFCRFDAIDDFEVSKALFDAAEKWALDKGMDTVCGPLGFSDLERGSADRWDSPTSSAKAFWSRALTSRRPSRRTTTLLITGNILKNWDM